MNEVRLYSPTRKKRLEMEAQYINMQHRIQILNSPNRLEGKRPLLRPMSQQVSVTPNFDRDADLLRKRECRSKALEIREQMLHQNEVTYMQNRTMFFEQKRISDMVVQ